MLAPRLALFNTLYAVKDPLRISQRIFSQLTKSTRLLCLTLECSTLTVMSATSWLKMNKLTDKLFVSLYLSIMVSPSLRPQRSVPTTWLGYPLAKLPKLSPRKLLNISNLLILWKTLKCWRNLSSLDQSVQETCVFLLCCLRWLQRLA